MTPDDSTVVAYQVYIYTVVQYYSSRQQNSLISMRRNIILSGSILICACGVFYAKNTALFTLYAQKGRLGVARMYGVSMFPCCPVVLLTTVAMYPTLQ